MSLFLGHLTDSIFIIGLCLLSLFILTAAETLLKKPCVILSAFLLLPFWVVKSLIIEAVLENIFVNASQSIGERISAVCVVVCHRSAQLPPDLTVPGHMLVSIYHFISGKRQFIFCRILTSSLSLDLSRCLKNSYLLSMKHLPSYLICISWLLEPESIFSHTT